MIGSVRNRTLVPFDFGARRRGYYRHSGLVDSRGGKSAAGHVVYSASTSFFVPFLITFVLYARIFIVLRRRLASVRLRRQTLPPEATTTTGTSIWSWRLRRRKREHHSELKKDVESTFVAGELSEEKSSSGGLEVRTVNGRVNITASINKKLSVGPRDASCQLKSCQLPRNSAETTCTTSPEPSISCV